MTSARVRVGTVVIGAVLVLTGSCGFTAQTGHVTTTSPSSVATPIGPSVQVANQFKGLTVLREEFPHLKSRLPTLRSRSYFVATVGAVSASTVQRYIDTQYERPWRKEHEK